ncbi:MAG: DUF1553 domain-containing protein [Acidimicrobiia bacterium]|nr:DUF1553 domain-containing protein [Acidimicrobiia bacterium]
MTAAAFTAAAQGKSIQSFSNEELAFFATEVRPILDKNCSLCHDAGKHTSGFSIESRESILAGGNRGPAAVPGSPQQSRLIQAVRFEGELKMPPTGRLAESEIAVLERWVALGLPSPSPGSGAKLFAAGNTTHWSFQPIRRLLEPKVKNTAWVRNPIDRFVLARLEKEGFEPSPEAARSRLIRRLSLDLVGLLPSPAEIREFLSDQRVDAYGRLVDRLLSSPHYGERWGRHWLDQARYADSDGYNIDGAREIWMFRDWVINALNRDLPFDQFVIEQVGGDLLPNPTTDQRVATGFHRNTLLNLEGGIDFEQYRAEAVADRVDTTGAVFLGLTLGCARCHDHKFDPISQREFYQLYAFFNNVDELAGDQGEEGRLSAHKPILEFGTADALARREAFRAQLEALRREFQEFQTGTEATLLRDPGKLKPEVLEALRTPPPKRHEFHRIIISSFLKETDIGFRQRSAGLEAFAKQEPKVPSTLVMRELATPRETFVQIGGDFLRKGVAVSPSVPAVLPSLETTDTPTRLDLARWLVDRHNPLTARVTVNRVWQRYFGKGLVATDNDFGTQGSPPTHPELLDWLANEFIEGGWSQKKLHRLIVTSATYRQDSRFRPELAAADPENHWVGRQQRLRLEAEIIRDAALTASGLLNPKIGGPSVFPPQPEGASKLGQIQREWIANSGPERYRRGIYTYFWRASPHPGLMVFDAPDSTTACTRRNRSNTPLQALTLLNDHGYNEFARGLAQRILREPAASEFERVGLAFRLSLSRTPRPEEASRIEMLLSQQMTSFQRSPAEAVRVIGPDVPEGVDIVRWAAWTSAARALLNLDEFVTRE